MKEQYIGDINDYRKYALLRALAHESGLRVGVCWMMTPPDGRPDGNKMGYLDQPELWRKHDPELFDDLSLQIANGAVPNILDVEALASLSTFNYFNDIIPDDAAGRDLYFERMNSRFSQDQFIFFDPDNGLDVRSVKRGRKNSSKFVFRSEISDCLSSGKSTLFYQHYPREERGTFEHRIASELAERANLTDIWAFRTAHVVFFLIVTPEQNTALGAAARKVANKWEASFLSGRQLISSS